MRAGAVRVGEVLELPLPPSQQQRRRRQARGNARARAQAPARPLPRPDAAALPARGSADFPRVLERVRVLLERAARPFREPNTDRAAVKIRARELWEVDREEALLEARELTGRLIGWLLEEGKPA